MKDPNDVIIAHLASVGEIDGDKVYERPGRFPFTLDDFDAFLGDTFREDPSFLVLGEDDTYLVPFAHNCEMYYLYVAYDDTHTNAKWILMTVERHKERFGKVNTDEVRKKIRDEQLASDIARVLCHGFSVASQSTPVAYSVGKSFDGRYTVNTGNVEFEDYDTPEGAAKRFVRGRVV